MLKNIKWSLLLLLTLCTNIECNENDPCRTSKDRFYRFSNKENRFDAIHVSFQEEVAINNKYPREDPNATYTGTSIPPGINDGYNATPSGVYKQGGENLVDKEYNGTYTGTSIPPGVNDGYFGTPIGHYKDTGLIYIREINGPDFRNNTQTK